MTAEPSSSPTGDDHRGELIRARSLEAVALRELDEALGPFRGAGRTTTGQPPTIAC